MYIQGFITGQLGLGARPGISFPQSPAKNFHNLCINTSRIPCQTNVSAGACLQTLPPSQGTHLIFCINTKLWSGVPPSKHKTLYETLHMYMTLAVRLFSYTRTTPDTINAIRRVFLFQNLNLAQALPLQAGIIDLCTCYNRRAWSVKFCNFQMMKSEAYAIEWCCILPAVVMLCRYVTETVSSTEFTFADSWTASIHLNYKLQN